MFASTNALSDSRFRRFFAAHALSAFGDSALYLALAVWAKELTGSNAAAGAIFLPMEAAVLLSPATGYLVDRVRRLPLTIMVNLITAAGVLGLLFVHSSAQVWILYAVAALYGVSLNTLAAARYGLLKDMLPDDQLGSANASVRTVSDGIRIIAPVAGAGLFAWAGGHAVA